MQSLDIAKSKKKHRISTEIGSSFKYLTVVGPMSGKGNRKVIRCKCVCGKLCYPTVCNFRRGGHMSCGCMRGKLIRKTKITHGDSLVTEYHIWHAIKSRVGTKTHRAYARYGGRGIDMDPRWQSYQTFLADMGRMPSPRMTVGRIDNDAGYWPSNCRWETYTQQARNTRNNRIIRFRGIQRCVAEWAEIVGVSSCTIYKRLDHGDSPKLALRPVVPGLTAKDIADIRRRRRHGESVKQLATEYGVKPATIYKRISNDNKVNGKRKY